MLLHFTEQEVPTAERNLVSELQDSRLAALLIFRHKERDTADGGGPIVNISSIGGIVGQNVEHMEYNASKGVVRTVTKSAA